ncbi:phosphoglycerate dehydrogenase [Novipirellula artificiosorum]|uniref:D-3-phosphoglycerate dehydrogenase n=1 Tax=Novipirellula artificiosorum TaxID=2528016 RepID=A0A5C6DHY3_9BACT|nr:phosphoglycerate dehydrogenase [Novipirellula artificiosorum]TWU34519.1 D-3-phosphoglycerate dehydrogenase [Novipirellula artificiosorum]
MDRTDSQHVAQVLVTCPPMQRAIARYQAILEKNRIEATCPEMVQELSESELIAMLKDYDGWIIGDDPATERVFRAGTNGRLRAAVKWGVGVDNVDFDGAKACGLHVQNTPGMFGDEVADVAMGYVIALARHTFEINHGVHQGQWPKPTGLSLRGTTAAVLGLGDIGQATVRRLLVSGVKPLVYDPNAQTPVDLQNQVERLEWPRRIGEADFLIVCCAMNAANRGLINADLLRQCKRGVRIVNVSRGPLIDESALCDALASGQVQSAALEVFEREPLPSDSPLRQFQHCLFGSHNASNTAEAVDRTTHKAVALLVEQLKQPSR